MAIVAVEMRQQLDRRNGREHHEKAKNVALASAKERRLPVRLLCKSVISDCFFHVRLYCTETCPTLDPPPRDIFSVGGEPGVCLHRLGLHLLRYHEIRVPTLLPRLLFSSSPLAFFFSLPICTGTFIS